MRCASTGDPHVRTFSGKSSHPQGSGPFVLAQSADQSFVVQTCHKPIGSGSVSINKALAIKTPVGVIKYTDGVWNTGSTGISCPGGVCKFPGGEKVAASGRSVWVEFPSTYCSKVSGLCGAFNPDVQYADTFTKADGTISNFNGSPLWGTFQSDFAESYAAGDDSLFSASECPQPLPNQPAPPPTVPFAACPLLEAVAKAKCPRNIRYNDCIMDVGVSCDLSWIKDAKETPPGDLGARPTPPPTPVSANCQAGSYFDGTDCKTCPKGLVQPQSGQYSCQFCAAGTTANADATACMECPEGCSCSGKAPPAPIAPPTCIIVDGMTVVQYHSRVHFSWKCHNDGTKCTCTNTHPTHRNGNCKQFTHSDGTLLHAGGDCAHTGHGGVFTC